LGLAGASQTWQVVGERTALAELPLKRPGGVNILLIVLDTVRSESLSLYGYHKNTTPYLKELAKRGVCFDSAISPSPWTLPAHASMFTGKYPHQLSSGWYAPLDNTFPTLAEVLGDVGYVTSGFVANTPYCSYETGLNRGFAHFEDYAISTGELFRSSSLVRRATLQFFGLRRLSGNYDLLGRKNAANINETFLSWLDRNSGKPFFTFLNYFDAHDPYLPPPLSQNPDSWTTDQYRLACSWWFMDKKDLKAHQIEEAKNAYESCISYLDGQIAHLFDELYQREVLENTVVIITSDHGEMFGEHGLYGHGNCLYRPVLQVPLVILYPSIVPQGRRIAQPVSLRDIPATVLDLIGEQPLLPGRSLARHWRRGGEPGEDDYILSEIAAPCRTPPDHGRSPVAGGRMQALLNAGKMYIKNLGTGTEQLYDFTDDPSEEFDLIGNPENKKIAEKMRHTLQKIVSEDR
jgi:arylsulfatase A-like enzyme